MKGSLSPLKVLADRPDHLGSEQKELPNSAIQLMMTYVDSLQKQCQRGPNEMNQLLVVHERLIYMCLYLIEQGRLELPLEIENEIEEFVQRVNQVAMNELSVNPNGFGTKHVLRAIDLLMGKPAQQVFQSLNRLNRLKVLTFSNLSYIYRDLNKYPEALKAVNFALLLEEKLAQQDYGNSIKQVVTSYLNRSAILSELNKHDKAIQSVDQAVYYIGLLQQQSPTQDDKIQILYLYMVANFNLANEHETLGLVDKAVSYYQFALMYSTQVKNEEMINKINSILDTLQQQQQK